MKKFNFFCSLVVVITMAVCIISFAQNITLRTSAAYTFYFNDTYVVESVSSEYVNSEMSDMIAGFFNSWNPEEFQIYEDTGYDIEGLFDEKDNYNMLTIKKALDISLVFAITSLIISIAIYVYFIKNDFKPVLRNRFKASAVLTAVLLTIEMFLFNTKSGLAFVAKTLGLKALEEDSNLAFLLGEGFVSLADNFLFGFTVFVFLVVAYVTHILTKPPRIFF